MGQKFTHLTNSGLNSGHVSQPQERFRLELRIPLIIGFKEPHKFGNLSICCFLIFNQETFIQAETETEKAITYI